MHPDIPLLDWYWNLFNQVLQQNDMKLLIIGYGFLDPHINRAIGDAILQKGLKIYILDPQPLEKMEKIIRNQASRMGSVVIRDALKRGLAGYFQSTVAEVFPMNQVRTIRTPAMQDIEECFFGAAT